MGGNRVYFCAELSRRNLIILKSLPWLVETLTLQPAQMLIYLFFFYHNSAFTLNPDGGLFMAQVCRAGMCKWGVKVSDPGQSSLGQKSHKHAFFLGKRQNL